jgi:hypothetical protein
MTDPDEARSDDEILQHLRGVRSALLRMHKVLTDAERIHLERVRGPLSNTAFLQALIQDEELEWLRPFSRLIVEIDEFVAGDETKSVARVREFLSRVEALVEPAEAGTADRYERLRTHSPDVLIAHVELTSRLQAAEP